MKSQRILVIITSAIYIGTKGESLASPSPIRVERIKQTLLHLASNGFRHIAIVDQTIRDVAQVQALFAEALTILNGAYGVNETALLANEYAVNGPSRLEAALLFHSLPQLETLLSNFDYVMKLSAGYRVKNIQQIISQAQHGVVYRMGNPLRQEIRFCLTSFYLIPAKHFVALCRFFYAHLPTMCHQKPLEYYMYCYVKTTSHQPIKLNYPQLEAHFLSSSRSSNDLDYRVKELVFKVLAKLGLFAYQLK
ncbi:hypothetical protein [Pedobacter insulae]|uniref:Uncharacterized protein n=1 Tax=Pedobacter insulae TaxID=414048 RepID=A0A1I2THZ6_9SPHI|nr:hypothetical protein [Pedobacter insulae]SFG62106.1 hypothetical protein SAMN04489864_101296 [Pedobacter insulae]